MNICNANSVHVPDTGCDCEEMMSELIEFEEETRNNFADVNAALDGKQDLLTAGANITIADGVISASSAGYVGSENIEIDGNVILAKDLVSIQDIGSIVVDVMHPVGSIIFRDDNVNPATLFPGTVWEEIKGKFLLGHDDTEYFGQEKYPIGTTGGSDTHTISIPELPSHSHDLTDGGSVLGIGTNSAETTAGFTSASSGGLWANTNKHRTSIAAKGGGMPMNIMPPYLVVSIWKRTA